MNKKGDENDVNNFRGVTFVSCMFKLFTAVLNKRVNSWSVLCLMHSLD